MYRRVALALLAVSLLICPIAEPPAAAAPGPDPSPPAAIAAAPVPPEVPWRWQPSPKLLAQVAGALTGFGVYSQLIEPHATAIGGVVGFFEGRLAAATLAGAGAVAGTLAYDAWAGQPLDYAYIWHRGGFVAGIGAGILVFGVLGYPGGGGATWLGWTLNRAALLGTGLIGAWAIDRLHQDE